MQACTTLAQINTFYVGNSALEFARGAWRSGSNFLIPFGQNSCEDFAVAIIDSNGSISAINNYGSPQAMEFPFLARPQDNGEVIICGWNFWDSLSNTNIGNYKGYVMVVDTLGQFKRAFHVKSPTTYFNKVRNGIRLDNYYYFTGQDTDSSEINPPIARPYLCKTDTNGNILWYKTFPQFDFSISHEKMGLEFSHNQSEILLGLNLVDSLVNNTWYYTSYFLMRLDTAGNFLNRIPLPKFAVNEQYSGINPIKEIKRISGQRYILACHREWYLLDQGYNIMDSLNLALKPHYTAFYTHKGLYDESFLIGSNEGFGLEFNGEEEFSRDYSNVPTLGIFVDVIPTYDGGYFAVANKNSMSTYIKMDCAGNYLNPKVCYPLAAPALEVNATDWLYAGGEVRINHNGARGQRLIVHDISGRIVIEREIPVGYSSISMNGFPSGTYIVSLSRQHRRLKTMKILVDH
jgi:hypothetical protein